MNPMTNMKNVKKLSEQELHRSSKSSWHDQYRDSAWIFVGGLPYDLTEGDLICVFSQYGEIVNINLVRDKDSGKQKGFCFVCYEDQRSTVLAVDNLNGIKILGRTIRVDHVNDYKMPKDHKNADAETKKLQNEGCGPSVNPVPLPIPVTELPKFAKEQEVPPDGFRLPPRLPIGQVKIEKEDDDETPSTSTKKVKVKKSKKSKKSKKKKSKKKHKKHSSSDNPSSSSDSSSSEDDTSDSEDETKKKRKTKDKIKSEPEEIQIKIERPSVDRIKTEDTFNRKNRNDNKEEMKYNDQRIVNQKHDHFKQNRREFDKFDNRRNYNDNRRYNDRENYRSFNNDRTNNRDERRPNNGWERDDRKRYNDRRDNREDSKRHRR